MSDHLSPQRLLWMLRADVLRNHRGWLAASGTAALVALLVSLLGAMDRNVGAGVGFYQGFFIAALFAMGTLATSQAFVDLHGRTTNTAFLLLPASALEKTLARLLLTTAGLFVYLLVLTTALSWALEGINAVMFGVRRGVFVPFDGTVWSMLPHYLVVQSLFFVGAAWFRKLHYVKTVGTVLLIAIGLSVVAVLIVRLFGSATTWGGGLDNPIERVIDAAPIAYYLVLPVFCWFVAWLRVTEAQVSHGI
jgi:hypothetical protein